MAYTRKAADNASLNVQGPNLTADNAVSAASLIIYRQPPQYYRIGCAGVYDPVDTSKVRNSAEPIADSRILINMGNLPVRPDVPPRRRGPIRLGNVRSYDI